MAKWLDRNDYMIDHVITRWHDRQIQIHNRMIIAVLWCCGNGDAGKLEMDAALAPQKVHGCESGDDEVSGVASSFSYHAL